MVCALLSLGALQIAACQGGQTTPVTLPPDTDYTVVERGANHRVWEKTTFELGPNGATYPKKHHYTELATGMHYQKNGQWVESQEIIEPYPAGAIARQGQYQVIFANNLNSHAAIDQQTPDGKRIRSNILGLEYYDRASGKSALIAQVKDSQGELISASQVLYPDSFQGVKADVRYTYKKDAFEQDVILREQPPTPEAYGLDSKTTVLEVMTEFLNPPTATVIHNVRRDNGLTDDSVNWGVMRLGHGRVFDLGEPAGASKTSVYKQYLNFQGRQILLEGVPVKEIRSGLSGLPEQSSIQPAQLPQRAVKERALPPSLLARAKVGAMKLATTDLSNRGFVLDYVQLNTSVTNCTFQADTTYYISGTVNVSGYTKLEGGTVLKYPNDGTGSLVPDYQNMVTCLTGPYRPVILTSMDDNTVGETVSGSSGNPVINGCAYISIQDNPILSKYNLNGIRACYAGTAILDDLEDGYVQLIVSDSQFVDCSVAFDTYSPGVIFRNVLFSQCEYVINNEIGGDTQLINVTADMVSEFINDNGYWQNETLEITNSILSSITNMIGYNGESYSYYIPVTMQNSLIAGENNQAMIDYSGGSYLISSAAGLYQPAGAGSYYLATSSPYRGVGTANIDPYVWAELPAKTTVPPLVYSNLTLSVVTNYSSRGIGDTNAAPDLGYHYDVLDYAFGGVTCYSNMTFNAGTAIGWFEPSSNYGLSFYDHAVASFNGTATAPCVVARYSSVQEGGNGLWKGKGSTGGIIAQSLSGGYSMSPTNAAQAIANFTRFYLVAGGPNHFRELNALIKVTLNNSEMYGASMAGYWDYFYLTNSLFDRCSVGVVGGNAALMAMRNCTVHGGNLYVEYPGSMWPLWIQNCAFDSVNLSDVHTNTSTYCDYCAIVTNLTTLPVPGGHDVIVTNFYWQSSWYGNYYLPPTSPLINAGSTTADQVGLYHFTTQTNQVTEGDSSVDIGYHYIATDVYGNPVDSNGDGIPDYLEDANGNGVTDSGEVPFGIVIDRPASGAVIY